MPETYGLPEPEPTPEERVTVLVNEVVAGQSVQRTVALYAVVILSLFVGVYFSPTLALAAAASILLMASDPRLS